MATQIFVIFTPILGEDDSQFDKRAHFSWMGWWKTTVFCNPVFYGPFFLGSEPWQEQRFKNPQGSRHSGCCPGCGLWIIPWRQSTTFRLGTLKKSTIGKCRAFNIPYRDAMGINTVNTNIAIRIYNIAPKNRPFVPKRNVIQPLTFANS